MMLVGMDGSLCVEGFVAGRTEGQSLVCRLKGNGLARCAGKLSRLKKRSRGCGLRSLVPTPTPSLQGEEDDGDEPVVEGLGDHMEQDNESMPDEYLAPGAARKKLRRGQDDPAPPGPPPFPL